ncbi:MAG: proton-conducting transporter membrane subunit [Acidimicrobiia bacterium]|nr:proton-conducting transporter membrane subunit [Acidimicrobiia bacterium]
MGLLLLLHAFVAVCVLAYRRSIGRAAWLVVLVGPLAALLWAAFRAPSILGGETYVESIDWVPSLDLSLMFRVDGYALLFLFVIATAAIPIFLFSRKYFSSDARVANFAGTMVLFGGSMIGLVTSDHLLSVFVFWELTTITSYLLIGFDDHKASARSAALHAAIVTGAGGLAMLGGFVLLAEVSGSYLISEIVAAPPEASTPVTVAWVLILVGAATKSAQVPFHAWLPGAMAAPTPASAFLHSATMVKAGIFLVGRLAPAAVASTGWWQPTIITIGFATMALGGWRALRQYDLKLLLAYGTVSQLGFMFLLTGAGTPELLFGGLALLAAHALFKAALFLLVGAIDHEAKTRDIRRLSGLRTSMPGVFWTGVAAALSMAAVPLTIGFAAKEAAFDALVGYSSAAILIAALASVLTVAYTGRFLTGAFGSHDPGQEPAGSSAATPRNWLLWAPLSLTAVAGILGVFPGLLFPFVDTAVETVTGVAKAGKLVLWPGWVPALAWSTASLGLGMLLSWRPTALGAATDALGRVTSRLPTAEGTFRKGIPALLTFADRSSGLIQNGSLPAYLATILLVAVIGPSVAIAADVPPITRPTSGTILEWTLGILIVGFAVSLVFVRRRFAVVILLGGVGFGIAGLYAVLGGPDLSLTQLLVETLVVALFAFVLRHLPAVFARPATARAPRLVVASLVGLFVFVGGLIANSTRSGSAVSETYLREAQPEAAGSNVVNVILVDFRAFDTLGELTVLVAATLGAAGLIVPILRGRRAAR